MKKISISISFATAILCTAANAQNTFPLTGAAGIGTLTPNASSLLEIKHNGCQQGKSIYQKSETYIG